FQREKRLTGSQRINQFGGPAVLNKNQRAYNCTASPVDRLRFFQECFWVLLCGSGAGFSVIKSNIEKLPEFTLFPTYTTDKVRIPNGRKVFVVPDSIEGWADSLGVLLSSYFENPVFPEYYNTNVEFDFSLIRPKGSKISSTNGKAPGPEPLARELENIRKLLDRCIKNNQKRLRPIDAYDIVCYTADSVLSGGVRRSATICLFSIDDEEMINAKTGNWYYTNPQRQRSNNSAILLRDTVTFDQFNKIFQLLKTNGDPGFAFVNDERENHNPCIESKFFPYIDLGQGLLSGWQMCNLCSLDGKKIKNKEELFECCKAAAIIGTLQAGFTKFDYLGKISEKITEKEALLGVSITGIMDNPDILLNEENQKIGAEIVKNTNIGFSKRIGINPAARCTNIKPEGTTSCLFATSSGIHTHNSRRYIRYSQANTLETPYQYFKRLNPKHCERSFNSNNKDEVISFCIEVDHKAKLKKDVSAIEMLNIIKKTQENWIEYGTNHDRLSLPFLRHAISATLVVKDNEWEEVAKYIYENRNILSCLSFLSAFGDRDYNQAPFTEICDEKEIAEKYGEASVFAGGLIS
ncbi:MAG: recombinase, partial [Nanoarchaeota archaeon]